MGLFGGLGDEDRREGFSPGGHGRFAMKIL